MTDEDRADYLVQVLDGLVSDSPLTLHYVVNAVGTTHLVELHHVPGTSTWLLAPLCRNNAMDIERQTIQPVGYRAPGHVCFVCQSASRRAPESLGVTGKEQYERMANSKAKRKKKEEVAHA